VRAPTSCTLTVSAMDHPDTAIKAGREHRYGFCLDSKGGGFFRREATHQGARNPQRGGLDRQQSLQWAKPTSWKACRLASTRITKSLATAMPSTRCGSPRHIGPVPSNGVRQYANACCSVKSGNDKRPRLRKLPPKLTTRAQHM